MAQSWQSTKTVEYRGRVGAAPGERRGGRGPGTPNKDVMEKALIAERAWQDIGMSKRKLAKDVIEDFMQVFCKVARLYEPKEGVRPSTKLAAEYERWAKNAVDAAKALAPYQSPTMKAIVVAPMPDQQMGKTTRFPLTIFDSQRNVVFVDHPPLPKPETTNGGGQSQNE